MNPRAEAEEETGAEEGMYSFAERSSSMSSDLMALNEALYFVTLMIVAVLFGCKYHDCDLK